MTIRSWRGWILALLLGALGFWATSEVARLRADYRDFQLMRRWVIAKMQQERVARTP